jgi:acetyl-CoA carboxylase biotin carboxyl carrier protein
VLTFEQIQELIDQVANHRLTGVEIERSGFRLKIDGYKPGKVMTVGSPAAVPAEPAAAPVVAAAAAPAVAEAAAAPAAEAAPAEDDLGDAHIVNSPIVGTFYRRPNPEADPYADVGTRVKKGDVLCIIEAMKLMNEIEADADGVVVKVFPKNAQAVEFEEPLFAIKTD